MQHFVCENSISYKKIMQPRTVLSILIACLLTGTGCASHPAPQPEPRAVMWNNAIVIDDDGEARDPDVPGYPNLERTHRGKAVSTRTYDDQLKSITASIKASPPDVKVLIFVHGGLNGWDESLQRARKQLNVLQTDPAAKAQNYYPIFICWDSRGFDSYKESVGQLRQGQKIARSEPRAWAMMPLYVVADLGRAITRFPIVWIGQGYNDAEAVVWLLLQRARRTIARSHLDPTEKAQKEKALELVRRPEWEQAFRYFDQLNDLSNEDVQHQRVPSTQIAISIGDDKTTGKDDVSRVGLYVVTSPAKFGFSPLIDALGKTAWECMCRRTMVMFERTPEDAQKMSDKQIRDQIENSTEAGAMSRLMNALAKECPDRQYVLVGHSMGAIVLCEAVRRYDQLYYKDIVFMAAACSVRDFDRSIVQYLQHHTGGPAPATRPVRLTTQPARPGDDSIIATSNPHDPHLRTNFYNLCLHPVADMRELDWEVDADLVPRGSLLVWIDGFLAEPRTTRDLTLGRWQHLVQSAPVIPREIRGQIHIKAFELHNDGHGMDLPNPQPQRHSDFTNPAFAFWNPDRWTPGPPIPAEATPRAQAGLRYEPAPATQPTTQPGELPDRAHHRKSQK
jgi:pimeloyl-ACP methyl ester carboxylesterase